MKMFVRNLVVVTLSLTFFLPYMVHGKSTDDIERAQMLISEKRIGEAVTMLTSIQQDDADWQVSFWLGTAYLLSGQLHLAEVELDHALSKETERAEIWLQRGLVEAEQKRMETALGFYAVATQVDPSFALAYLNAGIVYAEIGQDELARQSFASFVRLSTTDRAKSRKLRADVLQFIASAR